MQEQKNNSKPKTWKLLFIAWVFVYIVVNIVFAILGPYIMDLHPLLRTAIITTVFVPTFGLGIPVLHRKMIK